MKIYLKEFIILLIQLLSFFLVPIFAGPTDMMGVVVLLIMMTFILSVIIGSISRLKIKYLYPIVTAILFIPSIFVYYNESALIHSLWYLVDSYIGLCIGNIVYRIISKK